MWRIAAILGTTVASAVIVAGCVVGEGSVTSETREVRAFDRIEIGAGIHITVTIGAAQPVEVRAQANVLPQIATNVEGDILKVEARGDFTSSEAVTVVVVAPALEAISLSGGAQADIEGLDAETIEISAKGGSHVNLAGAAEQVVLTADGGSTVDLAGLAARNIDLNIAGGATATVAASDEITGSASDGSHLTVLGGAHTAVETSGGAEVAHE
jgi:hypothetical protein